MRAGCRVACGPTAQPPAPASASRSSRTASSIARPPPLLVLQERLGQLAGPLASRPAVVFIPPAAETGGQERPTAADCVSSSSSSSNSDSSLAGGHTRLHKLAALSRGEQQHLEQQEREQQDHQQPRQHQQQQHQHQQQHFQHHQREDALGGSSQLAMGAQLTVDNDLATSSGSGGSNSLGVQLNEQLPQQQSPPPPGEERDKDFFANVGDAIRTLREDYPLLFVKSLNYGIYREDLEFKDPNLTFRGLKNYRIITWSLRFHGRLFLRAANVQILRIWQPEDAVIKLRWQINASPRVGAPGTFDGISVYRLDSKGKVYQHEVTDVQMRDPPITNPLLYGLNFILAPRPQVQQVPCPGSWFEGEDELLLPDVLAAGGAPVLAPSGGE